MSAKFDKTEAKMYAALGILFRGEKFGAKHFMTFDGMTPERAEELESYKRDMTPKEVEMIVDCLPPIPGWIASDEKPIDRSWRE